MFSFRRSLHVVFKSKNMKDGRVSLEPQFFIRKRKDKKLWLQVFFYFILFLCFLFVKFIRFTPPAMEDLLDCNDDMVLLVNDSCLYKEFLFRLWLCVFFVMGNAVLLESGCWNPRTPIVLRIRMCISRVFHFWRRYTS
jgi:hypothetical protein